MTTADTIDEQFKQPNVFVRIYRGETSFDFVGRRRLWFTISAVIIAVGLISLATRGLNLGIEFNGGSSWTVVAPGATVGQVTSSVQAAGVPDPTVEILGGKTVQVTADLTKESEAQQKATKAKVQAAMQQIANQHPTSEGRQTVSVQDVGATWGSQITHKAVEGLIVFFIVIVLYISLRFEWKMAVAALVAVIHDLLVTAGIYSITGLQVTPDTVIAILTILGYSLYDTVVVFDRVADNTKGFGASGRMTYVDVVNLSMNQTLARSINTSLVAILPVLSVLLIGAYVLGATLQYFGFALVIRLISGTYSSIFIASPLLAMMKEREPRYRSVRQKLEARSDRSELLTPRAAAVLSATAAAGASGRSKRSAATASAQVSKQGSSGVLRPGAAKGTSQSAQGDGCRGRPRQPGPAGPGRGRQQRGRVQRWRRRRRWRCCDEGRRPGRRGQGHHAQEEHARPPTRRPQEEQEGRPPPLSGAGPMAR